MLQVNFWSQTNSRGGEAVAEEWAVGVAEDVAVSVVVKFDNPEASFTCGERGLPTEVGLDGEWMLTEAGVMGGFLINWNTLPLPPPPDSDRMRR